MILKKALSTLVAFTAIASAAGVAVIAAAFALYAVLAEYLRPAGAAAIVALLAALLALLGGLIALRKPHVAAQDHRGAGDGLSGRALEFARAKPLVALGAALALGFVAYRNPKIVTAAVTAFLAGKSAPKS